AMEAACDQPFHPVAAPEQPRPLMGAVGDRLQERRRALAIGGKDWVLAHGGEPAKDGWIASLVDLEAKRSHGQEVWEPRALDDTWRPEGPRLRAGCEDPPEPCQHDVPLRAPAGRGRGPSRSDGRVRCASAARLSLCSAPTSPILSAPKGR